jgi:hypothetical protein
MKNLTIQDRVFLAIVAPITLGIVTAGIYFVSQIVLNNINLY